MIDALKGYRYRKADKGHNRYCGPGVISILLGVDTAEAAKMFRDRFGYRAVRGVYPSEIVNLLSAAGKYVSAVSIWDMNTGGAATVCPTFNMVLKSDLEDGMYFVFLGRHFGVLNVRGNRRYYNDNIVGEWVNARTAKGVKRRARVRNLYRVK